MNEAVFKKARDFAEGLLAASLAGAVTVVIASGANIEAKVLVGLALTGALSAGIAYTRWFLGQNVLPLLKEIATRPADR